MMIGGIEVFDKELKIWGCKRYFNELKGREVRRLKGNLSDLLLKGKLVR